MDGYKSKQSRLKLSEIPGYEDHEVLAASLVERLDSLPWKYTFTIKLPGEISMLFTEFISQISLTPNFRIIGSNSSIAENYPLTSDNKAREHHISGRSLLTSDLPVEWDENAAYLQIEAEGFVGRYGGTETVAKFESLLRAFCGLGLALNLFKQSVDYIPSSPTYFYVHKKEDHRWKIDNRINLSNSFAQSFNSLVPLKGERDAMEKKYEQAKDVINIIGNIISNNDNLRTAVANNDKLKRLLLASDKILLASEWLFNSHSGHDELLNFIQTMVAVEILLSDKEESDDIKVTKLLANRGAYLIANTHAQRQDVKDSLNKIYTLRSKIVHRGHPRLNADERAMFYQLRVICGLIIREEVRLLEADFSNG